nr:MOSC domain-containing protein [Petropleomorpha daqingensis]
MHDNPDFRVTLVSTGTLGTWDRRRFRANVVLDGEGEDALAGTRQQLGTAVLDLVEPVPRCVMVTRPQPGGIGRDNGVLKTIHRERDGLLAVGAGVLRPGTVAVGDELQPVVD